MVELGQVGRRHHQVAHGRGLGRALQRRHRRGGRRAAAHAQQDRFHVVAGGAAAHLDDTLHVVDGVFLQQLQDANVVLHAAVRPVLLFQGRPQFAEERGQLPAAKDVGVIERRRSAPQGAQIMLRIEDLLVLAVTARMRGQDLIAQDDVDALDVGLDRHRLKSRRTRHAVAVVVEADHLVLVGLGRLHDARVEVLGRQ